MFYGEEKISNKLHVEDVLVGVCMLSLKLKVWKEDKMKMNNISTRNFTVQVLFSIFVIRDMHTYCFLNLVHVSIKPIYTCMTFFLVKLRIWFFFLTVSSHVLSSTYALTIDANGWKVERDIGCIIGRGTLASVSEVWVAFVSFRAFASNFSTNFRSENCHGEAVQAHASPTIMRIKHNQISLSPQ
jgi:hypothetical protein